GAARTRNDALPNEDQRQRRRDRADADGERSSNAARARTWRPIDGARRILFGERLFGSTRRPRGVIAFGSRDRRPGLAPADEDLLDTRGRADRSLGPERRERARELADVAKALRRGALEASRDHALEPLGGVG